MKRFGAARLYREDISALHRLFFRIAGVCPDHLLRFKYLTRFARRIIGKRHLTSILDAGCGPGDYSFYFAANYPGCDVLGIDISEDRIDASRRLLQKTGLRNLGFEHQDILDLNRVDAFDFICCVDVLEHVDEQRRALRNFSRALREDGYLYVHIPLKRLRPVIFDRHLKDFHEWVKHEHIAAPHTKASFLELLEESGFAVLASQSTFNHFLGEFAVSITTLFYKNTLLNRIILCLLMPFMCFLVYLDYWIENKTGNALAVMAAKHK